MVLEPDGKKEGVVRGGGGGVAGEVHRPPHQSTHTHHAAFYNINKVTRNTKELL